MKMNRFKMSRFFVALLLPLMVAIGATQQVANGQTTVITIGTDNPDHVSSRLPFCTYFTYGYTQSVYRQEEVGLAGLVGAITFKNGSTASTTLQELTIWMGHSSTEIFSEGSWVAADSLTQVFHATNYYIPAGTGEVTLMLDTPFRYDGLRDLAICISQKSAHFETGVKFQFTRTEFSTCLFRGNDDDPNYSNHPGLSDGIMTAERPNISIVKSFDDAFCFPVKNFEVTNITDNQVEIVWEPMMADNNNFEVAILDTLLDGTNLNLASVTSTQNSSYTFANLQPNTTYKVGVRTACGNGLYGDWCTALVHTTMVPQELPYMCDFESEGLRSKWFLDRGGLTNHWVMDINASDSYAMYISDDSEENGYGYNTTAKGCVFASSLIHIPDSGDYDISYDWRGMGEGRLDYMRVMLLPAMMGDMIASGTLIDDDFTTTTLPEGFIALDGGMKLNGKYQWNHFRDMVTVPHEGNYYLAVLWTNNYQGGDNPPAAIDNISIEPTTCFGLDSVVVDQMTATSVVINAYSRSSVNFIYYYKLTTDEEYDTVEMTSPFLLTGLMAGSSYEGYVRAVCEGVESFSATPFQFRTACTTIELPWLVDADAEFDKHSTGSERFPYCWECVNGDNGSYYWKDVTEPAKVYAGERAIRFYGTSFGTSYDEWLITPMIHFNGGAELTMWVKSEGSLWSSTGTGRFAIYASTDELTSATDTAHFIPLTITGENMGSHSNIVSNNHVRIQNSQYEQIKVSLPTSLIGNHRLAFVVKGVESCSFDIDDIYFYTPTSCATPSDIRISELEATSATLTWRGEASSYTVYYGETGFSMNEAMSVTTPDTVVALSGLNPNTKYEYIVVATCSDGATSTPTPAVAFRTACTPIANASLPFVEDFSDNELGVNAPLDACWFKGTNDSWRYPYAVNARDAHTPNALLLHSEVLYYSYAALPAFEESINNLVLTCSVRHQGSADNQYTSHVLVGLMSNPYDYNTFCPFDTLRPLERDAWTDFQISLSHFNIDSGSYIAFAMPKGMENEALVDDIKVELAGHCAAPSAVEVTYVSYDEAEISWHDEVGSSWTVYYGEPGFEVENAVYSESVTGTPSTYITDLLPQTEYEVCVVTHCTDGSFSVESLRQRFTTTCAPIVDLPYLETFESYGSGSSYPINECWVRRTVGPAGFHYPFPAVMAKIHGNRGLVFKAAENVNSHYNSYVALPAFEEEIINLKVRFDMKNSINPTANTIEYSKLAVGVMANPNDLSTFDTVAIFDMSELLSGTVYTQEVLFDHYQGSGSYIALMAMDVERGTYQFANNNIYVDDIEVNLIPSCARPSQLTAVMDINTADLSWVGNSSAYEVAYSQFEDMSNSTVVSSQGNSLLLNNLTPYTDYYINVRGQCDDGSYSEWMFRPVKVRTLMDCGEGYQHLFDTLGNGSSDSYYYTLNGSHLNPDTRTWNIFTREDLASLGLMSQHNIIRSIQLHASDVGDELYFRVYMAERAIDEFSVDLSDTIPLNEMTLVYDGSMQFIGESWNEIILTQPFTYRDSANLVIAFERNIPLSEPTKFYCTQYDTYTTAYVYGSNYGDRVTRKTSNIRGNIILNVCAEVPACIRPMGVTASQITAQTATISWQGSSDQYQVVYTASSTLPDDLILTPNNSVFENASQLTLQGLIPNTTYNIYVRGFCGNDTSLWSNPISFTTPCGVFPLPYSENFDSYRATNDEYTLSPCWVVAHNGTGTTGIYPSVDNLYASSGTNSLKFYATPTAYSYAALPQFNAPIADIVLSFKLHKKQPEYGTLEIGVMTNPHHVNTFERVATVQPQQLSAWEEFEVSLANYAGEGQYIAFMAPDSIYSYVSMDDLEVFVSPTCQAPIDVRVAEESITGTSAVVSWTDRSSHPASYVVQYGPAGFELGTGDSLTTTSNPVTLTHLNPATRYEVYVKSQCSESSTSRWSIVASFVTSCVPLQLPVTYNFDAEEAGKEAPLPLCFSRFNDAQLPDDMHYPYINASLIYSHSESHYIYFALGHSEGQADREAIIFPAIDIDNYPMSNTQVSLWGRCRDSISMVAVGIISDLDNIATFVPIDTLPLTDTYAEYIVNLSSYTGTGAHIAIMAYSTTASYTAYIDDVAIEPIPTCPRVFDLHTVSVSGTSATIDWTDSGNPSQWVVDYHINNASTVHHMVTNTKPCTLTSLNEMTDYVFNVRPICGVGDTGHVAISEGTFTTLLSPASIPYAYDFESDAESGKWRIATVDPTVNWYRGTALADCQGTYSLYISPDQGASCTTDWWDIYNATVYRDIDFGPDTSSFTITFKAKVGGTSDYAELMGDDINEGLYVMLVNPMLDVEPSIDEGISPWGDPDTMGEAVLSHLRLNVPWRTYSFTIDNVAGIQRLAFHWSNTFTGMMGGMISEISCAIDSIVITEQSCVRPQSLQLADLSASTADIAWRGHASHYQVMYRPAMGVSSPTYQLAQGNRVTLSGLRTNTEYKCQVRAICAEGDTSAWSDELLFRTNCQLYLATDTIREDFTNVQGGRYNETGLMPGCWQSYPETHDANQPHVVGLGSYWYSLQGNSLTLSAGQYSGYTESLVRLPYTLEPVNSLTLSYWMCTESSSKGQLQVGYLTGLDYQNDFVAIDTIPASMATVHKTMSGAQGDSVGYFDTITFSNVPDEALAVALRWVNTERASYVVCIDNVVLTSSYTCASPIIDTVIASYDSIALAWQGSASSYQLKIKETDATQWLDSITLADTHYTFRNLLPATEYSVLLRAQCDENNLSAWVENLISTHELNCIEPNHLSVVADYDEATLSWNDEGDAMQWVVRISDQVDTRFDTVTSQPYLITNLYSATEYRVAVKSLCGLSMESDWSEPLTFTTRTCPTVNAVSVSDITAHTAVISWQCPEAHQWELMYGEDIDLSTGTAELVTEPHYTLSNLQSATQYDVYVRSACSATAFGEWSERLSFTTLTDGHPEGIDGVASHYQLTLYPNPTHSFTTITLQGIEGKVAISVVDMNGRLITNESIECGLDCEKRIDVAGLAQGTYFIHILGDNINSVRKLIVR